MGYTTRAGLDVRFVSDDRTHSITSSACRSSACTSCPTTSSQAPFRGWHDYSTTYSQISYSPSWPTTLGTRTHRSVEYAGWWEPTTRFRFDLTAQSTHRPLARMEPPPISSWVSNTAPRVSKAGECLVERSEEVQVVVTGNDRAW